MGAIIKTKPIYTGDVMAEIDVVATDEPDAGGPHIDPSELDRIDEICKVFISGDQKDSFNEANSIRLSPWLCRV